MINGKNTIVDPDDFTAFQDITLEQPFGVGGNAYFTKIMYNQQRGQGKRPIYIQTRKSLTKQGCVKSGKKYSCDLMFETTENAGLIQWFEQLEERCQTLIYENKSGWFENDSVIEPSDIQGAFHSTIKLYKSGRFFLVHTNIKNNHKNEPMIKIFNEDQTPLSIESITHETEVLSILEVQGIKFSSQIFQIEIELKQVMVIEKEPFDSCCFNIPQPIVSPPRGKSSPDPDPDPDVTSLPPPPPEPVEPQQVVPQVVPQAVPQAPILRKEDEVVEVEPLESLDLELVEVFPTAQEPDHKEPEHQEHQEDILEEYDLPTPVQLEPPVTIHKPREVYEKLYREAREKVRVQKEIFQKTLLEAMNIKKSLIQQGGPPLDEEFTEDIDFEIDEVGGGGW